MKVFILEKRPEMDIDQTYVVKHLRISLLLCILVQIELLIWHEVYEQYALFQRRTGKNDKHTFYESHCV